MAGHAEQRRRSRAVVVRSIPDLVVRGRLPQLAGAVLSLAADVIVMRPDDDVLVGQFAAPEDARAVARRQLPAADLEVLEVGAVVAHGKEAGLFESGGNELGRPVVSGEARAPALEF